MNPKPTTFSILLNDNWAAPALGGAGMIIFATLVILLTNPFTGDIKGASPLSFIWMTGVAFPAAVLIAFLRVRYVCRVFENGVVVQAQVLDSSHHKSALRLKVRYTHFMQTHEKELQQVITGKTKMFLTQKEVALVIDQNNPKHILLRDVYF